MVRLLVAIVLVTRGETDCRSRAATAVGLSLGTIPAVEAQIEYNK